MRRLTVYLPEVLCDAIAAHAESQGQKLSTFVSTQLAHLVHEPVVESAGMKALRQFSAEANAKAEGR